MPARPVSAAFDVWALNPFDWRTVCPLLSAPAAAQSRLSNASAGRIGLQRFALRRAGARCRPLPPRLDPHDGCYFERPPERLVLEGYRRWLAGYDSGSVTPWEMTQALYEELLGAAEGRHVLAELSHFVRTLRQCAACPLRSFPFGAHHVCRDECVALGLIAALQHDDHGRGAESACRR